MRLLRRRVPEEDRILPDDLSLRKELLQCEAFGNEFGHVTSHKAVPAAWRNTQTFDVGSGHVTADSVAVRESYGASHRYKPHI